MEREGKGGEGEIERGGERREKRNGEGREGKGEGERKEERRERRSGEGREGQRERKGREGSVFEKSIGRHACVKTSGKTKEKEKGLVRSDQFLEGKGSH